VGKGQVVGMEGLLAAPHGGTLFLDEVGDLSSAGQAMLLRFLQEREVRPIGSRQAYQVDVRVIAATNKDLEGAMARGEFRADLYDRLREVVVEVPPLRERREDIPLLIEHFLEVASARHGRPQPTLGREARRALLRYDWPGNVRAQVQALGRSNRRTPRHLHPLAQHGLFVITCLPQELLEFLRGDSPERPTARGGVAWLGMARGAEVDVVRIWIDRDTRDERVGDGRIRRL
jgi:sigma54-dependent transcription regulator